MIPNTQEFLQGLEAFRAFPETERLRAGREARYAHLQAGEAFYHHGQRIDDLAWVVSGSLRVFRIGESGREITLYHVQPGEPCLVNLISVLLQQEACATAQADLPTTAVLIPGRLGREWMGSVEGFRSFFLDTMGKRLLNLMTLVEEIAFRRMDQRLAEYLQRRCTGQDLIEVTHEAIASELGTAREVISRLLGSLALEGVIELGRGWIRMRHPEALPFCAPR